MAVAALGLGGLIGVLSDPAGALTVITVTNNGDAAAPPAGSLRAAFTTANTTTLDDVEIVIPASVGTITLTAGELAYNGGPGGTHALTLQGNGNTIDQTTANTRVIDDTAATLLTVNGLVITGGHAPGVQSGGGIFTNGAATISNTTITQNSAPGGGNGGGLHVEGNLILTSSTINANTAAADGGGALVAGTATVTSSTISGNTASGAGAGGLEAIGATVLTNSTVSDNTAMNAAGEGGGLGTQGSVTLIYSTVFGNRASTGNGANIDGSIAFSGSIPLTSFGSVVGGATGGGTNCANLSGTTSHGFNLEDDAAGTCGFSTGAGDLPPNAAPNLGALANNGGSTQTRLPQPGSPLIDAIPFAHCHDDGASGIATDQRGFARPSPPGGACDIGAVEVQVAVPPTPTAVVVTPAPAPIVVTPRFTG